MVVVLIYFKQAEIALQHTGVSPHLRFESCLTYGTLRLLFTVLFTYYCNWHFHPPLSPWL